MDDCTILMQEQCAPQCRSHEDEDAVDTTDQGSSASDIEVASSLDSASVCQSDVGLKLAATRTEGHELGWLVPSVCSRRALLRGVGHDVLEKISNDETPGDQLKTTFQGAESHDKLVLMPKPPGLPSTVQKEKLVLLPTLLGHGVRAPSAPGNAQNAYVGDLAKWKAAMVPRKVPCGCNSFGYSMHITEEDMPLKKRPLFNDNLLLTSSQASMPMKKTLSSFLLRDPPTVVPR